MTNVRRRVRAFGIDVDALTFDEAVETIRGWLETPVETVRYVVTPNLDHAVLLRESAALRAAYHDAALVLPDGMPLLWAARARGQNLPERVAGSDLAPAVLAAAPAGTRVFLLGAAPKAGRQAAVHIESSYPQLTVVGRLSPPRRFEHSPMWDRTILNAIERARPNLILVGLGAPKQEVWTHQHASLLPPSVALCVGATIDFIAGAKTRAPAWMQRAGLEWLHRAAAEPHRLAGRYARDAAYLPFLLYADWRENRTSRQRGSREGTRR